MKGKPKKTMAQILNLSLPNKAPTKLPIYPNTNNSSYLQTFADLQHQLRCNGRFYCLFSNNNHKQEQARKALESALGGNKEKFEKWNQEIKKREEAGGGGNAGGGGWFGWGGRFGWSGDNFWQEAQQASLALLGLIFLYLIAAKGDLMLAVILNPVLFALRGTRNGFTYIMSLVTGKLYPVSDTNLEAVQMEPLNSGAKDRVVKKWGTG